MNDTASFPERSCTAAFEVAVLDAGATYATATFTDGPIADGNVSVTVDPLTTAVVGVMMTVLAVTVNALADAVVACNASLKVNTTVVPFTFNAPDVRVGETSSTPVLL